MCVITEEMQYFPKLTVDIVLGMNILSCYPFTIDLQQGTVILKEKTTSATIECSALNQVDSLLPFISFHFLDNKIPKFKQIKWVTPLIKYTIHLLQTEPIKQRYQPRNPHM